MKEFFADPYVGLAGLLFFFAFFCVATFWTFRPGAKNKYKDHANIPMRENDK